MKKTKFIIPGKRAHDMDAWVSGAVEKLVEETQKSVFTETSKQIKYQKIKRLTIDLDSQTHKEFKLKALNNDTNMVDLVRGWIQAFLGK